MKASVNIDREIYDSIEKADINVRVQNYINTLDEKHKNRLQNKVVSDFPELGFDDYFDVLNKHESKKIEIYPKVFLDYNEKLLNLIGTKWEINTHKRNKYFWPIFTITLLCSVGFYTGNLWMLIGFVFLPFSNFVVHTFIGSLCFIITSLAILILLWNRQFDWVALPFAFIITMLSAGNFRDNYKNMLINRALSSEILFIFLLYFEYINVFTNSNGKVVKLKIVD